MISYAPKISADKLSTAGRNSFGQSSIHMSLNKLYLDCWEIMHLVPGDDCFCSLSPYMSIIRGLTALAAGPLISLFVH